MYYVYIIESETSGIFYKGSTSDYNRRLSEHNEGTSKFTKSKGPWKLIFVIEFESKMEVLVEEKRIKKCNKTYLQWLVKQPVNVLNKK